MDCKEKFSFNYELQFGPLKRKIAKLELRMPRVDVGFRVPLNLCPRHRGTRMLFLLCFALLLDNPILMFDYLGGMQRRNLGINDIPS